MTQAGTAFMRPESYKMQNPLLVFANEGKPSLTDNLGDMDRSGTYVRAASSAPRRPARSAEQSSPLAPRIDRSLRCLTSRACAPQGSMSSPSVASSLAVLESLLEPGTLAAAPHWPLGPGVVAIRAGSSKR